MKKKNPSKAYLCAMEDMRKEGMRVREIALRTSSIIRQNEISDKQCNGKAYFNYD